MVLPCDAKSFSVSINAAAEVLSKPLVGSKRKAMHFLYSKQNFPAPSYC